MSSTKRQDILSAALNVVSAHGFHGASMAMIAEEAKSGAGTIYNYFPTKDELIKTLFREIKAEYVQAILTGVDESMPLERAFQTVWRNAIRFSLECPAKVAFSQQYHSSPYFDESSVQFINEVMAPLVQPFLAAMQTGKLKQFPLPVLQAYTLDIVYALVLHHMRGEIVLDDDLIEQTGQASWQALLQH